MNLIEFMLTNFLLFLSVGLLYYSIATANDTKTASIDVGPTLFIPKTKSVTNFGRITPTNTKNVPLNFFKTAREGQSFQVSLSLSPGTYDVDLGFVEAKSCRNAARVFHIDVNSKRLRESFDIFKAARGCRRAYIERIPNLSISSIQAKPIVLKFVSVSGLAAVSYIRAMPSKNQCVPVSRNVRAQGVHLAHSIPGEYDSVVDSDENKFENVLLDGRGSHTHFSYSGGSGRIIAYEWSLVESGKVISRKSKFVYRFPLGTTRVRLTVTDNVCSQDSDETSITVTTSVLRGQYCYFYPFNGQTNMLQPKTLWKVPRPLAAVASWSSNVKFQNSKILEKRFVTRCLFFVRFNKASTTSKFSVNTAGSGRARVYKGKDMVLDTSTSSVSEAGNIPKGFQSFEIIYVRTNLNKKPQLNFKVDGRDPANIFYDISDVLPIITRISPQSGSLSGGTKVHIHGFGLHRPLKVWFGNKAVYAQPSEGKQWEVIANAPRGKNTGKVWLQVQSSSGLRSNAVNYEYGNTCDDVSFKSAKISTGQNKNINLNQPTSVALGNDNRLYIGTRGGLIQVVRYDVITLRSSHTCSSEKFRDSSYKGSKGGAADREILGITFDPRDKVPRPYVSVSTTYWDKNKKIDPRNKRAWANGAVERFKPATAATRRKNPSQCLEHDRNIVRNLPVSDADHSINQLLFDQNGDLLITVGGNTNMGLPGKKFGGMWETYFSASVVIARLSRGAKFNGAIPYTSPDIPHRARPKRGYTDVDIYAAGFRNLFSLTMARNGRIYGVDMGPNNGYGNASTTCSQYNKAIGNRRVNSVPGKFVIDAFRHGEHKYGPARKDKLVEVKQGKFYGHPNIQRALMTNKRGECAWIDPVTGKRPGGANAPYNYEHHLSYFDSAATSVQEYGSTHFCERLRGDLLMTTFGKKQRGTLRAILQHGKVSGVPGTFTTQSGIRVVENVQGDLLFPQYQERKGILAIRPKVRNKSGLSVLNALPFRHGRRGGTTLTIGGRGFRNGARVVVGGKNCPIKQISASEIKCTVPAMSAGTTVSITVSIGHQKSTLKRAILYMKV